MSSSDHCIITKYDLSEREKEIKKSFFMKKEEKKENAQKDSKVNIYSSNLYNDEVVNKLVQENFNSNKIKDFSQMNNNIQSNSMNPASNQGIPLNLIYSQNKILERNVDILQETQRSIHDLLVFNLKSYKNKENSKDNNNSVPAKQMQALVAPLYQSVEELKNSINNIINNKINLNGISANNDQNQLNDKVSDMISRHSQFKESTNKLRNNMEIVEKNKEACIKENSSNNLILKAISELKTSVGQITSEMNKIESDMNENLKRIINENEKKNLKNILGTAINSVNKATNSTNNNFIVNRNNFDEISYVEYRNELLEINQRTEEILNEISSCKTKISIPKLNRPTEKINFSYKLDFESESDFENNSRNFNSGTRNKFSSNSVLSNTGNHYGNSTFSIGKNNKDKNVFLNNYDYNTENEEEKKLKQSKNLDQKRHNNRSTSNNRQESKEKKKSVTSINHTANNKQSIVNIENTNEAPGGDDSYNINIVDNMNINKEKLKNYKLNNTNSKSSHNHNSNLNTNYFSNPQNNVFSTKNSESNPFSTENTPFKNEIINNSNNLLIDENTLILNKKVNKSRTNSNNLVPLTANSDISIPTPINPQDNNFSVINPNDSFKKQLKLVENEIKEKKSTDTKLRKGISVVEVTPQDQKRNNIIEDLVMKLCIEKMLTKNNNKSKDTKEGFDTVNYIQKPENSDENNKIHMNLPFKSEEKDLKSATENLLGDYVKNLIKNKKLSQKDNNTKEIPFNQELNSDSNKDKLNSYLLANNELSEKFKQENDRRDRELTNYLNEMMNRFKDMENTIKLNSNNSNKINSNDIDNMNIEKLSSNPILNMEDMVNKIADKLKSNMQININLTTNGNNLNSANVNQLPIPIENNISSEINNNENRRTTTKDKESTENYNEKIDKFGKMTGFSNISNNKEETNENQLNESPLKSPKSMKSQQSNYSHPFADTRRVDYEEANRDIPLPHMINLQEYEISSSSYISDTRRSHYQERDLNSYRNNMYNFDYNNKYVQNKPQQGVQNTIPSYREESVSEGQYITDNQTLEEPTPKKINSGVGIDFNMLKKFNEKLKEQLTNIDKTITNQSEVQSSPSNRESQSNSYFNKYEDNSRYDPDEESSSISINVQKHMVGVDINNNEDLKTLNLYDSDEHKLFQQNFRGNVGTDSDRLVDTQMTKRFLNNYSNHFSHSQGEFKFYKQTGGTNNFNSNRSNETNYQNRQYSNNPTVFSFQNVLSNRTESGSLSNKNIMANSMSSAGNNKNLKLTKVSNDEMEVLLQRQNSLNEKMKSLSKSNFKDGNFDASNKEGRGNMNNTIPENVSEVEATIQVDEERRGKPPRKVYRTDESSLNESSSVLEG
jgi:hypothetical protein